MFIFERFHVENYKKGTRCSISAVNTTVQRYSREPPVRKMTLRGRTNHCTSHPLTFENRCQLIYGKRAPQMGHVIHCILPPQQQEIALVSPPCVWPAHWAFHCALARGGRKTTQLCCRYGPLLLFYMEIVRVWHCNMCVSELVGKSLCALYDRLGYRSRATCLVIREQVRVLDLCTITNVVDLAVGRVTGSNRESG